MIDTCLDTLLHLNQIDICLDESVQLKTLWFKLLLSIIIIIMRKTYTQVILWLCNVKSFLVISWSVWANSANIEKNSIQRIDQRINWYSTDT